MVITFTCPCGNNDPAQTVDYDGAIGYEATICKQCAAIHDHNGIHYADDWSRKLAGHKPVIKYRIKNANGTYMNAGTGLDSWFTLEKARSLVNYDRGQIIVENDGLQDLWEIL